MENSGTAYPLVPELAVQLVPGLLSTPKDRRLDRLIRVKEVMACTGLSIGSIRRFEARNQFPKRVKIGPRCVGWYESDVRDYIADPVNYRPR
jgi:prophage regulatory protein